jgi:hypothetical protein
MPNDNDTTYIPRQDDSDVPATDKKANLDRIANEAAKRAVKREQRYDREHNIFTI